MKWFDFTKRYLYLFVVQDKILLSDLAINTAMKLTFVPLQRLLALVTGNADLCASSAISLEKEFLNHTCSQDQAAMTVYTAPPVAMMTQWVLIMRTRLPETFPSCSRAQETGMRCRKTQNAFSSSICLLNWPFPALLVCLSLVHGCDNTMAQTTYKRKRVMYGRHF